MRAMLTGAAIGVVLGGIAVGVSAGAWPEAKRDDARMATYQQLDLFTEVLARAKADYVEEIDEVEDDDDTLLDPEAEIDDDEVVVLGVWE